MALIFSEDAQVTDESARLFGVDRDPPRRASSTVIGETLPDEFAALAGDQSRHLRSDPHRARRAAVPRRHERGHDSARGRHRGSRDLVYEGLLRRTGSDRPRHALAAAAASRRSSCDGSPTRAPTSCRCRSRGSSSLRQGHRPRHERRLLARTSTASSVSATCIATSSTSGTEVTVMWNDSRIKAVVQ